MKLVLLTLQQELIDNNYEADLETVKRRVACLKVSRESKAHETTWERYKNGELHISWIDPDGFARHNKYPPGYDAEVVLAAMRNTIRYQFADQRAYLERPVVSVRKQTAPPDKHVMNKFERKELARLRQKSGKTEAELRQDPAVRRALAEARMLGNKPAGPHVFDGRGWITPHEAATRAVTKLRAEGVQGQIYQAELEKALQRART